MRMILRASPSLSSSPPPRLRRSPPPEHGHPCALELGLGTLGAAVGLAHVPRHLLSMLGQVPVLVALDVEGARLLVLTVLASGLLLGNMRTRIAFISHVSQLYHMCHACITQSFVRCCDTT